MKAIKPYRYEIGQELEMRHTTWTILGRKINDKSGASRKSYLCQCHKCNSALWKLENELHSGLTGHVGQGECGVCSNRVVMTGKNDVATTHPHLVHLFADPEDALHINALSREKRLFKCPDCGHEFETSVEYVVTRGRLCCPNCSDGISYPNKFARSVLEQLGVNNLESEYKSDWSQNKRYDFSFYKDEKHYLLEMDGGFHTRQRFDPILARKDHDALKDKLAKENNCILIRIECEVSDLDYIRKRMENSFLAELYDFSVIDWEKVEKDCATNLLISVNDYYNSHPNLSTEEIGKVFHLCSATILTYLKKGRNAGINIYRTLDDKTNEMIPKVVEYKLAHMSESYSAIGRALGISKYHVQKYLKIAQEKGLIDIVNFQEYNWERLKQFILQDVNKSTEQISRETGHSTDYIRRCKKELGLIA